MTTTPSPVSVLFSGLPAASENFLPGVSTVALVRSRDRLVVFDTGPYAYRPILQGRLRKLGIDPASVDTVVLSHVHWDTAANADLFPNATVMLHEKELGYADAIDNHDSETPAYVGRTLRRLKLETLNEERELSPGIRIVELPGHTSGSIGLLVGNELLAGDAVMCAGDAASGVIRCPPQQKSDATASLEKALALASVIYPGHDRPFRLKPTLAYLDDYAIRVRFFTDPTGPDEEIHIGSFAPRSFASWPVD